MLCLSTLGTLPASPSLATLSRRVTLCERRKLRITGITLVVLEALALTLSLHASRLLSSVATLAMLVPLALLQTLWELDAGARPQELELEPLMTSKLGVTLSTEKPLFEPLWIRCATLAWALSSSRTTFRLCFSSLATSRSRRPLELQRRPQ